MAAVSVALQTLIYSYLLSGVHCIRGTESEGSTAEVQTRSALRSALAQEGSSGVVVANNSEIAKLEQTYFSKWGTPEEVCHKAPQCYCIRHTNHHHNDVCGWCESTQKPFLGTPAGPSEEGVVCGNWIFKHEDCPYFVCKPDYDAKWLFELLWPVTFFTVVAGVSTFRHSTKSDTSEPKTNHEFSSITRTQQEFRKGLWGVRLPVSSTPYQPTFDIRRGVWSLMRQCTAMSNVADWTLLFGLYCSVVFTIVRLGVMVVEKEDWASLSHTLAAVASALGQLKGIVTFLFSFYVLGRVGWWWNVMACGWTIQGRVADIALLVGGAAAAEEHKDSGAWWEFKWHVYRYLMTIFVLTFKSLNVAFAFTFGEFEKIGLLEKEESEVLDKSLQPRMVVLKWLSMQVTGNVQDKHVKTEILNQIGQLRGATATLHDTMSIRAPMSFEAVMHITVYLWIITMPLAELGGRLSDREDASKLHVFVLSCSCLMSCWFYLCMVDLLETFKNSFGEDSDDLNPGAIISETETAVIDLLTSPVPSSLSSVCKDDLYKE